MKTFKSIYLPFVTLFFVLSCSDKEKKNDDIAICGSCHLEEEMRKTSIEMNRFDSIIISLYELISENPKFVIGETERILHDLNIGQDSLNVRGNKISRIEDLRTETFYRMGEYEQSISEIENAAKRSQEIYNRDQIYYGENDLVRLACNYVKLKDFSKAKTYVDKMGSGWYITGFIKANIQEVIGEKEIAIEKYEEIVSDTSKNHYFYYKDAQKRLEELKRANPVLLKELFFPSNRPDVEVAHTDNERRVKMFDMIFKLPEYNKCSDCESVSIHKEPKELNSSSYWIKVIGNNKTRFDFLVDTLTFEIKHFDTITKKQILLAEWRKKN